MKLTCNWFLLLRPLLIVIPLITFGCASGGHRAPGASLADVLPGWSLNRHNDGGAAVRWGRSSNTSGAEVPDTLSGLNNGLHNGLAAPIIVFIEGDGRAWRTRSVRGTNPTPHRPVAAELAALSASLGDALYLGRPCQFFTDKELAQLPQCTPTLWADRRYSREVVTLMSAVLDEALGAQARPLILVGYSGGGAIAALLSACRSDVLGFVTVAANLDVDAWTSYHRVSPFTDAVSPVDYAAELAAIPQYHLLGSLDTTVPAVVHDAYLSAIKDSPQSKTIVIDGYDHSCCWQQSWLDQLRAALAYFNDNGKRDSVPAG
jgi:pimeloyl-ACP methyl ester carboxylesterase